MLLVLRKWIIQGVRVHKLHLFIHGYGIGFLPQTFCCFFPFFPLWFQGKSWLKNSKGKDLKRIVHLEWETIYGLFKQKPELFATRLRCFSTLLTVEGIIIGWQTPSPSMTPHRPKCTTGTYWVHAEMFQAQIN